MKKELVIVLDFGGQYNQLVARRVRECNVYCEIYSYKTDIEKIKEMNPKGIILTGGPNSCYEPDSPTYSEELFKLGIPVLGLCYGAQLMSHVLGGKVERADVREYGKTEVIIDKKDSKVFEGVSETTTCWMSHFDYISKIAPGFEITAHTADCPVAAAENAAEKLYAIQFHPEVLHTVEGTKMINNFVKNVCECAGDWKMDAFVENTIAEIREKVGNGRVLLALSGGVDSSVAAGLLSKAIGKQLTCVFVDHGLLRKNEGDEVEAIFGPEGQFDLNFIRVNAQERYYNKLAGVTEPEAKRKIIGEEFIRIFEEEAKKIGTVEFLAQGTIYPDVVESGLGGESAVIKSHHNVGGLPDFVDFKEIIEPLRDLFKDEVRKAGLELGLPERLVFRQPFPGPGLGVRIIGEVTAEKVRIVQDADAIYREEIENAGLDKTIGQYFAALTNMRSVGVMGDERTYDYAVALRAVKTIDFMTEFQRVQNRAYAASALNAKSTGLQAYVDGARADIYVTVKISKEDFAGGASNVTLLMEAKERETGFSLANASIVSDRFRASKKELTEYALEGISENFFNQLKQAFRDMVTNGREVNITLNVDENCDFDMENDAVGTRDMTLSDELDEWVLENAFKGNGEVRSGGNGLNVYMRVPVYDPDTGRPRSIKSETGKLRRFASGLLKDKGYTVSEKAASGQYIQLLIQNSRE